MSSEIEDITADVRELVARANTRYGDDIPTVTFSFQTMEGGQHFYRTIVMSMHPALRPETGKPCIEVNGVPIKIEVKAKEIV